MKITFNRAYNSIPSGFSFEWDGEGTVNLNGITIEQTSVRQFVRDGVVSLQDAIDSFLEDEFDDDDCGCCEAETLVANTSSEEFIKINEAMESDKDLFVYGEDYVFYSTEEKAYKVSTLLKTASHIGRVVSGFGLPANASARKKYHRLVKLNYVYNLGLEDSEIRSISNFRR